MRLVAGVLCAICCVGCRFDSSGLGAVAGPDVRRGDVSAAPRDAIDLAQADRPVASDGPAPIDGAAADQRKLDARKDGTAKVDAAKPDVKKPDAAKPDAKKPDAAKPDALSCPTGYTKTSTGCRKTVTAAADWLTAEKDCENDSPGAHLVVVDNATENGALPNNVWIGLSERVTAGVFLTVTGMPQGYTAYAPGEPIAGGAQCIEKRSDGWHDDNCYEQKSYVCEHDGVPASPSAY